MTDTTQKATKGSRKRMPVIGQRVPEETRDLFNKIAKENYNTTPANLHRALMEAVTKQPGKGKTELLKVQVSAGVTKDELSREVSRIVRKELAAFFPASTPKIQNDKPIITTETTPTESYNEEPAHTDEEKMLIDEFNSLSNGIKFENETLYVSGKLTSHDGGESLRKVLSEMKLTRIWQNDKQVSTITKPNGGFTFDIAKEVVNQFKVAWIASRLKK